MKKTACIYAGSMNTWVYKIFFLHKTISSQ